MPYNEQQNTLSGVALGTQFEIIPAAPLAEFNSLGATAYAARRKGGDASNMMALVCTSALPPRIDSATSMRSSDHKSLLRLIESGVITWPSDDTRRYALLFERPTVPRMMASIDMQFTPLGEDALIQHFIAPMCGALIELARCGVVHNGIRPDQIFWRFGSTTAPVLNECLSTPAGLGQPVMFETMERGMCMPQGRGPGLHSDDCYALGVTIALLATGQNPLQGLDDATILQSKIDRGSFATLIGTRRLPASHIEVLRGLLADDPHQRWTAAELEQWITGRRLTPKHTDANRRAARHLDFQGKHYWHLRPLAAAFSGNVAAAAATIESGELDKWLRRAIDDERRATALEQTKFHLKERGKSAHYEEQLVSRACIIMDPAAPIRYRGLSLLPPAIGPLLAEAAINGNHIQILSEMIANQLVSFWIEGQKEKTPEMTALGQLFERARGFLEKSNYGNGIERVLYEINLILPCLSPIIRSQYATAPKAILPALEKVAASAHGPEPMDRHLAAFLIVRDRRSEFAFDAMNSDNPGKRGIALLNLFSDMQTRHANEALPGLAQWLLPLLEPGIQRFHGKTLREKIQTQLRESASRGNLSYLAQLLDDPRMVEHDRQEFSAARMLYLNTMKEIAHLETALADRERIIHETGKPMAATISSFLAILLVMAAIFRAVVQYLLM